MQALLGREALWRDVDGAVDGSAERAFELLESLVRIPSLAGFERPAQELLADELSALGFDCRWVGLTDEIARLPGAGRPLVPVEGRSALVGERRDRSPSSLLINGHIDVVPADDAALWSCPPFAPIRRNGTMIGRGTGDMKGGLVMALLALWALDQAAPDLSRGRLQFVVVPEEESSGNGTLATVDAGVLADAVLLPEPTNLRILLSGIGVLWCELTVTGSGAHAGGGGESSPLPRLTVLLEAVSAAVSELGAQDRPAVKRGVRHHVNLGRLTAGDWPSSVPSLATGTLRLGFPSTMRVCDVEAEVLRVVDECARRDDWLREHPPRVRFPGLRAEPHALGARHPLARAVAAAHRATHGRPPKHIYGWATSDARFYINQAHVPALCYGPRAVNVHGVDEAVDLGSVVAGARTYARLIPLLLGNLA